MSSSPDGTKVKLPDGSTKIKRDGEWVDYEPSMMDRARDALPAMPGSADDAFNRALNLTGAFIGPVAEIANAATFGLNDDMAAALATPGYMAARGVGPVEAFNMADDRYERPLREYREESPLASLVAGVGGGFLTGMGLGRAAERGLAASVEGGLAQGLLARFLGASDRGAGRVATGAQQGAAGAAQGGLAAIGEGTDIDAGAGTGMAISAATGGILGAPRAVPDGIPAATTMGGEVMPVRGGMLDDGRGRAVLDQYPRTAGEQAYIDSRGSDPDLFRMEQRARSGLSPDTPLGRSIADFELNRDDYILAQMGVPSVPGGPMRTMAPGDAGAEVSGALAQRAQELEAARTAAYRKLGEYQPFMSREALTDVLEGARMQLFDPPTEPGFSVALTPEALAQMPQASRALSAVDSVIERVRPVGRSALSGPGGVTRFSPGEIESLRRQLQGLAGDTTNANEARIIRGAVRRLDELYDEAFESGAIQSSQGDPIAFQQDLLDARAAHRQYMDLQDGELRTRGQTRDRPISKLVRDIQLGQVEDSRVIDRLVDTRGMPKMGGGELLDEIDGMAPAAGAPSRLGVAARLFGSTVEFADDGMPRINDRRALISRLDAAVNNAPGFYSRVFGPEWVQQARRLVDEVKPTLPDVGRGGNRFNTENASGSAAEFGRLVAEGVVTAKTGTPGILSAARSALENRRMRGEMAETVAGMTRELDSFTDRIDPGSLAAWNQALRSAGVAGQAREDE